MYNEASKKATLIDFGLADVMIDGVDSFTKRVGSVEYAAPELVRSKTEPYSGRKVDVWTMGIVLFSLLTASFPFNEKVLYFVCDASHLHVTEKKRIVERKTTFDKLWRTLCITRS